MKNISIHLKNIFPQHIGDIRFDYNGNLTINASKFLAGKFLIEFNQIHQWNAMQMKIFAERIFFFFKQTYFLYFDYDLINKSLNLTFIHNNHSRIQWTARVNQTYFNQNFLLNTSLVEINQNINVRRYLFYQKINSIEIFYFFTGILFQFELYEYFIEIDGQWLDSLESHRCN